MSITDRFLPNRQASSGIERPFPTDIDAFDYVITSRADLASAVPPVSGVFNLLSGGYAFKDFDGLQAGERIVIPAGVSVRLFSMRTIAPVISGTATAAALLHIQSGAQCTLDGMTFVNNGAGTVPTVLSQGTAIARGCWLTTNIAGQRALNVGSASWRGIANTYNATTSYAVEHSGGRLDECESVIVSDSGNAAAMVLNLATYGAWRGCRFDGALDGFQATAGNSTLFLQDCEFEPGSANRAGISVNGLQSLILSGGKMTGTDTGQSGVLFSGAVDEAYIGGGARFDSLANAVNRTAGTQGGVSVCGITATAGCTNGVNFGTIPTRGLLLVGNDLAATNPIAGFTAATARVNMKANMGAAGLLTETAIVP